MPLSNQRFVTTWTSEDSVQWRMYIIPSSVDYISPAVSSNVTLPTEFLLRDMELDTELGNIPAGLVTQVLKINVNIAALQGTTALDDLRKDLLQGTTTKKRPLNSDGTPWIDPFTTEAQTEFDAFNTFVLQYNDGSGFKTAFIGCQKYSAENELEITPLQNVVKYSIEIYDIQRCIGEAITPHMWSRLLMRNNTTVDYSPTVSLSEQTQFNKLYSGFLLDDLDYFGYAMLDALPDGFTMYISTFARLKTKISEMYSKYMRALTGKLSASFVCHDIFTHSVFFRDWSNNFIPAQYLCYVSEIYDNQGILVGGALGDSKMFAQFTNFFEAYKMLCDNALETVRPTYTFTAGTPDVYTLTMVSSNPYPVLGAPSITFDQDTTYGNFKIKMFSEVLNQVTVDATSISGDRDTKSFPSGKQGASGDNSKDLKIMFHNVPQITNRTANLASYADIPYGAYIKWQRNTINSGYVLYFEASNIIIVPKPTVNIYFGGEDYAAPTETSPYSDPVLQALWKQQHACLPQTIADSMVNFLGRKKQAEASVTTTFTIAKFTDVGKRCTVDLDDYNPLLESIYGSTTALAVITKHTHKVYEGMADVTLRIDAEPE